jgi:hypothetical protein
MLKVRAAIRKRTGRTNGQSLESVIAGINPRWPNHFFEEAGLFNLTTAHAESR